MPDIGTFWFAMTIATGALLIVQLTATPRPRGPQNDRDKSSDRDGGH